MVDGQNSSVAAYYGKQQSNLPFTIFLLKHKDGWRSRSSLVQDTGRGKIENKKRIC